jgi:hypothetical protein
VDTEAFGPLVCNVWIGAELPNLYDGWCASADDAAGKPFLMGRHALPDGQLYMGSAAVDELDQAQAELDKHLPAGSDGRCLCCRQEIPCAARERASLTFRRYGVLPRRRPGLARIRPSQ